MTIKLVKNAAGRLVPITVNKEKQIPFKGVAKYKSKANMASPPIRSCTDYPQDGIQHRRQRGVWHSGALPAPQHRRAAQ